ncbi:MAG: FtsX-like permease family protein, partial [Pirellulales bacterium]
RHDSNRRSCQRRLGTRERRSDRAVGQEARSAKATGTANDRALFINVEGFYLLEGHSLSATTTTHAATPQTSQPQPLPELRREITSILVLCKNEFGPMILDQKINKGTDRIAQAIAPAAVVTRLKETIVGPVRIVLLVLTVLIIVVAGLSILVSIYNSMSERSRDIGVMRALGASRGAVMSIILVESILLALLGGVAGVLLGHATLAVAAPSIEAHAGITIHFWHFSWQEALLIPGLMAFATLVGFLPALTAYRTDVARSLG